jgi:hypothetical protein
MNFVGRRRRDMSPEERLAEDRELAQKALDGKWFVPTKTCIHCGGRALVADGHLESATPGCAGTVVVPIAVCLDDCKASTVGRFPSCGSLDWRHGRQPVVVVDGLPYEVCNLSQSITPTQRTMLIEFLDKTAPQTAA